MDLFFDTINLTLLNIAAIHAAYLFLILWKSQKNPIRLTFAATILSLLLWTLCLAIFRASSAESSLFWAKTLSALASLIATSFFAFAHTFPHPKPIEDWLVWLMAAANATMILLAYTPHVLIEKVIISDGEKMLVWGPLFIFYNLYFFAFLIAGLAKLYLKHEKNYGRIRSQLKLVFLGCFISTGLYLLNYLAASIINTQKTAWLSPITPLIMIIFTTYAIIAHRLMDIRLVLRKYSVNLGSSLFIIIFYIITILFTQLYAPLYSDLVSLLYFIFSILAFSHIRHGFYHIANRFFFSSLYDSNRILSETSDALSSTLEAIKIYDAMYHQIDQAMHLRSFGLLYYQKEKRFFSTIYNVNFNLGRRVNFEQNDYLQEVFFKKNVPIIVSELKQDYYNERSQDTINLLESMQIEIVCPLISKKSIIGLMVLGPKESGDMYNEDDLQVLGIVASQSAMAIENAMLFGQTKDFALRMEEEVKKATAELRAANEHLKKLDEAKSEFISIASHQLRTPLTVIKGYISMMLEGSFGPIAEPIQDPMAKVYESNERLISLVENLLNVSRIESGHLKFSFEPLSLSALVRSVGEELGPKASEKGLQLDLRLPKKEVSLIKADAEKIRQAVMNLIDNAIKYTSKGKITVTLRQMKDEISFSVKDKGLGIKPDDIPNLFHKFARGSGAMLEHTEGTGLGLYVAKEMIEAHGGRISAESAGEGKGSTFGFILPIGKEGVSMGEEALLRDLRPALAA